MRRARRELFVLGSSRRAFSAEDTASDLENALRVLLDEVGHDLGAEDYSDDSFLDYAGDAMSDAGVPDAMIDSALEWRRRGGNWRIRDTRELDK